MNEMNVGKGLREQQMPTALLESVRELNHRFLDLVAVQTNDWDCSRRVGLPMDVSERIAPLTALQKNAAANCPYVLFDMRFDDESYWKTQLAQNGAWNVADSGTVEQGTLHFVGLALFFAWHVASVGGVASRLLLGMSGATATAFRAVTIDRVPTLAAVAASALTARWSNCSRYWSALAVAASRPNSPALRRIQLYGLQLAAASRLG